MRNKDVIRDLSTTNESPLKGGNKLIYNMFKMGGQDFCNNDVTQAIDR